MAAEAALDSLHNGGLFEIKSFPINYAIKK